MFFFHTFVLFGIFILSKKSSSSSSGNKDCAESEKCDVYLKKNVFFKPNEHNKLYLNNGCDNISSSEEMDDEDEYMDLEFFNCRDNNNSKKKYVEFYDYYVPGHKNYKKYYHSKHHPYYKKHRKRYPYLKQNPCYIL